MKELAIALTRARIPGLIAGQVTETGFAQLLTTNELLPVLFNRTPAGIQVHAGVALEGCGHAAERYIELAAAACGCTAERSEGRVWMSITLPDQSSSIINRITEFCRHARQIAEGASWLASDDAAGTFWIKLADAAADFNQRRLKF